MQATFLIALALIIPAAAAPLMLFIKGPAFRKAAVTTVSALMVVVAVLLAAVALPAGGLRVPAEGTEWFSVLTTVIDCVTLVAILYFGVRLREWKIIVPSLLQAAGLVYIEIFLRPHEAQALFVLDNLGLVMLLISSVLGPIIAFFALGYMKRHEEHHKSKKSRQNVFFAVIFLFLFAMNAICISDNFMQLYAFWEVTTLCSFLLIGYDGNRSSIVSAKRALWLNSLGGVFLLAGVGVVATVTGGVSVSGLLNTHSSLHPALMAGVMLICCAGFVKSAQLPFSSWLLGAMVAPTPVSALLHSSTMVKAGVYIIVRMSPFFGGKLSGYLVALVGAFTFMATSAIAISQRNGKRVLAYSTIANLGLIIACAGLGGSAALSAAILLIIYHAVSKGLLFLCMGTVEQGIGSRMIEDMFGVFSKMPYTTSIMTLGMISMVLPPFGVLVTKWLALEAAVRFPPVLILIVLGSAFTIVFWVKWLGAVLTVYHSEKAKMEKLPASMVVSLGLIGAMIPVLTALLPALNNFVVVPAVSQLLHTASRVSGEGNGLVLLQGGRVQGAFGGVLALLVILCVVLAIVYVFGKINKPKIVPPYACGELAGNNVKGSAFIGPRDKVERVVMHNYYLTSLFSEQKLLPACGFISLLLIFVLFGVAR